ncbi:MAG: ABC-F family ATP-binding cassette domain-containing protein [Clostridiales bacterium]|nr:ABC-F family ATP-binding cassette domain-containing protein [Clostridiales bacterium]
MKNLSFSFGTNQILEDVSFAVDSADRCGIVGVNGAGKSTLFELISGAYEPDGGGVMLAKAVTIGYLRQNNDYDGGETIGGAVRGVFRNVLEMEAGLSRLEDEIGASGPDDEARQADLIRKYDNLRVAFERAGGYEYQSRIRGVLNGLDIGSGIDDRTPLSILSGGQKTRLALALMLVAPPDLLLLDEPTNHLDIRSLEWLEAYLKNYPKCFLVISHDRYFLDAVTNKTLELERRRLTEYGGGYSFYVKKKEADRIIQERHYINQQREIERLEAFIEQQRRWNRERNIIAAESRQKAIDRIERVERPSAALKKIAIRFDNSVSNSHDAFYIDGVSKGYDGRTLFSPFSALVRRGDRILILGPNGCGKSTLLRILSGQLEPDTGQLTAGRKIDVDYYDQEHFNLDDEKTVIDEVYDENARRPISEIRGTLAAFLFSGDDVFKKVGVLSGGEKARLALAKLVLSRANLLMLDEPTNHLDIDTRGRLEEALTSFDGVVIAVSHDRYFIQRIATRVFYFEDGQIFDFEGGYDTFLSFRAAQATGGGMSGAGAKNAANSGGKGAARLPNGGNNSWLAARESRSRQKKTETRLARLENRIDEIERRLAEIGAEMTAEPVIFDHVKLTELSNEQQRLSGELDRQIAEWEELSASVQRG